MKYRYPRISNTLTFKRISADSVEVVDHLTDNRFEFSVDAVRYVRQLDGYTHPYKIQSRLSRKEIDDIVVFLDEHELIRLGDTISISSVTKLKTLWIPRRSVLLNVLAYLSNSLLLISWLPVLITGIVLFARNLEIIEFDLLWTGYFIGLICGVLFHEFGHAFAGISYGAKVFEMGVMLMYRILPGAYVLLDVSTIKKRLQRIQINAAGVEMNFLLCGIFLVLGVVNPLLGGMFLNAAICNAFLGALNLTFIKGLDGAAIMSNLLGVDDIIDRARRIVFNREARKRVMRKGPSGYATVAVCYMLFALQIALPTLLITNVLEIISCFV